jgi:uncharacterized lipoprotein YddW (UPF0748 family)
MRTVVYWILLSSFAACSVAPRVDKGLARCIWVDRWDYRTPRDIERIMDDCRNGGYTAVLFQVRGNGTVCFRSRNEIWSEHFGFQDPGFDPLRTAVEAAHARGLELHAWVNLMPGWVGDKDPTDERQLWRCRQNWFLQDRDGRLQQRAPGKYLALNPCLPAVRRHLTDICREIVTGYDVDGLQLDYVRFPEPETSGIVLGSDERTLGMFTAATGRASTDTSALLGWQSGCVTQLVREIAAVVHAVPGRKVALSAAVFADVAVARTRVLQDWGEWTQQRLLDAVFPMDYTADAGEFDSRLRADIANAHGTPVVMGVGVYQHTDPGQSTAQLREALAAGARGIAVFNYRTLYGTDTKPPSDLQRDIRVQITSWFAGKGGG